MFAPALIAAFSASMALGSLTPPAEKLVQTMSSEKNFQKRVRAVMALIRRHDPAALPALKTSIGSKDPLTRSLACLALSGYPANFAFPLLDIAERDPVPIVKRSAEAARADILTAQKNEERQRVEQEKQAAAGVRPDNPAFPPAHRSPKALVPPPPPTFHTQAPQANTTFAPITPTYVAPRAKSGPRLSVKRLAPGKAPEGLLSAPRELSLAAADAAPGWWVGDADSAQKDAAFVITGGAKWMIDKNSRGEKVRLRVEGLVERPNRQLLGNVASEAHIDLPNGVTPEDRAAALQRGYRQAMVALVGEITDVINVDRQTNGESLLR